MHGGVTTACVLPEWTEGHRAIGQLHGAHVEEELGGREGGGTEERTQLRGKRGLRDPE